MWKVRWAIFPDRLATQTKACLPNQEGLGFPPSQGQTRHDGMYIFTAEGDTCLQRSIYVFC